MYFPDGPEVAALTVHRRNFFDTILDQVDKKTDMDLSSPGDRAKSRSSSSVESQNRQLTDSYSSNEPWQEGHEEFESSDLKSGNGLRGAASLPHIVNGDKSEFVLSKSESNVDNLDHVELDGAVARNVVVSNVIDDDDISSVVLRQTSTRHQNNLYEDLSPSLGSVADSPLPALPHGQKSYDYLLKFLLVGDSDVGKQEILSSFEDGTVESPFCSSSGAGKTSIPKLLKSHS